MSAEGDNRERILQDKRIVLDLEDLWAGCILWIMLTLPVGILAIHFGFDWVLTLWFGVGVAAFFFLIASTLLVILLPKFESREAENGEKQNH